MQVIATGKWSKKLKQWTMVVAMRPPAKDARKGPRPRRRPQKPRLR